MTTSEEFEKAARELRDSAEVESLLNFWQRGDVSRRAADLLTQAAAMARDAARYRWLENNQPLRIREDGDCNTRIEWEGGSAVGRGLTETVDAAMKEQK